MSKKGEGIKEYKLELQSSHGDVKYSIGNTVSNSVLSMCGVKGILDLSAITSQVI